MESNELKFDISKFRLWRKYKMEITHELNNEGRYIQVVSPVRLIEILRENDESLEKPDFFMEDDEWNVGEEIFKCKDCGSSVVLDVCPDQEDSEWGAICIECGQTYIRTPEVKNDES